MLDIRLLGAPLVTVDGEPIDVDTKKAIAILAYLVIEGMADREALAGIFWGDSPPERARATLRRTLSALRSAVGSTAIQADRSRIGLTIGHRSDVAAFDEAIAETTEHDHDPADVCDRCVSSLSVATKLYRGDFLSGFTLRDCPEFDQWQFHQADTLRHQLSGALWCLVSSSCTE